MSQWLALATVPVDGLMLWAAWRWGLVGLFERLSAGLRRLVEGPPPPAPRRMMSAEELAALEREIWPDEEGMTTFLPE